MLGTFIKTVRNLYYHYPKINQDHEGDGPFANLKIALVTDYLTTASLSYECRIVCLTTSNFKTVLKEWKPDFIFVESAFHGYLWSWSYKIAKTSKIFNIDYLSDFRTLINLARELKIPTVFWNKDDGAFFDTFIDAASLCDYIYTADSGSIEKYCTALNLPVMNTHLTKTNTDSAVLEHNTADESCINNCNSELHDNNAFATAVNESKRDISDFNVISSAFEKQNIEKKSNADKNNYGSSSQDHHVNIGLLQMAVQHRNHFFKGFAFEKKSMCFVGSYYSQILNERKIFLNEIFSACNEKNVPVDIYNRNSFRLSRIFDFNFPKYSNLTILPKLANEDTADIYRKYNVSLNVNSITDSPTMCSRRLLEILACGGILVTNNSLSVKELFKDYCTVINCSDEALELLPGMVERPSAENMDKAEAGSRFIAENFTWEKRLEQLTVDLKL